MAGSKKSKTKQTPTDDGFLMSPKVDFVLASLRSVGDSVGDWYFR